MGERKGKPYLWTGGRATVIGNNSFTVLQPSGPVPGESQTDQDSISLSLRKLLNLQLIT